MTLRSAVAILRTIEKARTIKEIQTIAEGVDTIECDPVLYRCFRTMASRKAEELRNE